MIDPYWGANEQLPWLPMNKREAEQKHQGHPQNIPYSKWALDFLGGSGKTEDTRSLAARNAGIVAILMGLGSVAWPISIPSTVAAYGLPYLANMAKESPRIRNRLGW